MNRPQILDFLIEFRLRQNAKRGRVPAAEQPN